MKQATQHVQEAIIKVDSAFPSIFTKQDVIQLLSELNDTIEKDDDVTNGDSVPVMDKEALIDVIRGAVENAVRNISDEDILDTDNAEFEIRNGNEIRLDSSSIGINNQSIIDDVMNEIENDLEELYERIEEKEEN